jgi:hypothetical protein
MRLGLPDTPSVVDDLYAVLRSEGFEVVEDRRGGMGGLQMTLRGRVPGAEASSEAEVEIAADRGNWTVALRFAGMSRFFDPRVWAAHLDGSEIGEPDVAEQARFVGSRLVDAAGAVEADAGLESELIRLGEEYMRRRLGFSSE